jgi:uncharacterized protein (TIGR03032 family)
MKRQSADNDALWSRHHATLRDPRQIVAQWPAASDVDPATFKSRTVGPFWDILDELELTLVVTREYEHLVQALCVENGRRRVSYLSLPHPNGLAVDRQTGRLIIASTRNPNMLFEFLPSAGSVVGRGDDLPGQWLPRRANYYPGCLYLHDIAMIGGALHGNAVGLNAIVRFDEHGGFEPVWWPRSIDSKAGPRFDKNYLQLNSIAAGPTVHSSYFGASVESPGVRRPGHRNFSVDKRGVIFSGATRDVCATGLTRPHSARLHRGNLWIDNSGYGETGRIIDGRFEPLAKLPGWTRGLYFHEKYLFVGTSRILPRFHHYAPGLDAAACIAGVHVLDRDSGNLLASYLWPNGNQIFAIEGLPRNKAIGFPFLASSRGGNSGRLRRSFGASRAA